MRRSLLLTLALMISSSAMALHILGGSITYEYLGGSDYRIRLVVLRDCFGNGAPFDQPVTIGVFDENGTRYAGLTPNLMPTTDTITLFVPNNVCQYPSTLCVEQGIYETVVSLPSNSSFYTLAYQRCCRSAIITNLVEPSAVGMTFQTEIRPADRNTSPDFNSEVPFAVYTGTPFTYDASASDVDGDSLVYFLAAPFGGGTLQDPRPEPVSPPYEELNYVLPAFGVDNMLGGNYPLTLDAQTGHMSAIPAIQGIFQISYGVKEFRNGVEIGTTYREFNFNVVQTEFGQSFDISGKVLIDSTAVLDLGKVQILERNIANDSLSVYEEQSIDSTGGYAFTDIPPGAFYVKALIDTASIYYASHLPTYYVSAPYWYEAEPMNQCDTSQENRDIVLLNVIDSLVGGYVLSGRVQLPWGDPVADLNLLLANENGQLLQARTTDSEGYFQFDRLENADYLLMADLINSGIDNTNAPMMRITGSTDILVEMQEDRLIVAEETSVPSGLSPSALRLDLYPNPVIQTLTLDIQTSNMGAYQASIYDTKGRVVRTLAPLQIGTSTFQQTVDLEELPTGVYYFQLQGDQATMTRKFIKQ